MKLTLDLTRLLQISRINRLRTIATASAHVSLPVIWLRLEPSLVGSLREACALVLLKFSCLQERAELRHKIGTKGAFGKRLLLWLLPFDVSGDTDKTRLNLVTHSPVCGSFPALDSLSVLVVLIFLEVWSLHLCFAWGKDKQSYGTKNARHCVSPY